MQQKSVLPPKYLVQQKSVLPPVQLCIEWAKKKLPTMQADFTHNAVLPTRWHSIWDGGYSVLSDNFRGVFCTLTILGGYSVFGLGLCDNFHFRGEGRGVFYRIGLNCRIWTKISTTPAGSCITDSLSHTTYVETNHLSMSKTKVPRL